MRALVGSCFSILKWGVVLGLFWSVCAAPAQAQIFGTVRGAVRDPQGRAIAGAKIMIKAQASAWTQQTETDATGQFTVTAVPAGTYTIEAQNPGFRVASQVLNVGIGSAPTVEFSMQLESVTSTVQVSAAPDAVRADASSLPATVSLQQIQETPGADRTNSMAFVTGFVPGAYMVHDQLHIRGGHQVSWLVDGVPVPNTNIASNVGPQFDPKDIATVEVSRGGYSAEYGDRTYGVLNVVTRSGFEFDQEGELSMSYGSFNQTNDQLSFGGHTDRFAYYASANGNRSDWGLEAPVSDVLHDRARGLGGFTSLIYNAGPSDQLRLVAAVRNDRFQIPNTPAEQAAGIADLQHESDSFVNLSWVHTLGNGVLATVSPFYHYNRSAYDGGPNDPLITTDHRTSQYAGAQATLAVVRGRNNLHAGLYGFYQNDRELFGLVDTTASGAAITQQQPLSGGVSSVFAQEQYQATSWLTLNGGVRLTHFSGAVNENAADPRIGASIRLPHLGWVLRGFYGRYYQPPPLSSVSGPLEAFAVTNGFSFLPLRGERDEQHEFGLTIPLGGWTLDFANFRTSASNFFDHDALGNSNIFLPLTIARARIRGFETTVRSPQLWRRASFHVVYSNQTVQGSGAVTGGLTDFEPPDEGFFILDHDQRNTLSVGGEATLPWQSWASAAVNYGSGFLNGDGPAHLPQHATLDLSLGKSLGERWSVSFSALNVTGSEFMLDNSNTFGGTHWNEPRQFTGQMRYRFHF
jgi:outer membrane receptor protein involved in Fe transport